MCVVYPGSDHVPTDGEHPVRSVGFPFYEGFRVGLPRVPGEVDGADLVHAHTPFLLGLAGRRFAGRLDVPLVASYHTPTSEYANYVPAGPLSGLVGWTASRYERWYMNRADAVVVPSAPARDHLREMGVDARIEVVQNGVDTDVFRPADAETRAAFRERHGLPEGPLVGYTGRHGYEKRLQDLIAAGEDLAATLVIAGDGPARADLQAQAADSDVDVRFLGFLDRAELPTFYSVLDVFAFPSPVETQGLVALEANACGTPVAGVDAGALADTVDDGETGYTAPAGDAAAFRAAIERTLADRESLRESCLARRDPISVEHAIDDLEAVYESVRATDG